MPTLYDVIHWLGVGTNDRPSLIGWVELWGTVIEHERGYRAQFARIVQLLPFWDLALPVELKHLVGPPLLDIVSEQERTHGVWFIDGPCGGICFPTGIIELLGRPADRGLSEEEVAFE